MATVTLDLEEYQELVLKRKPTVTLNYWIGTTNYNYLLEDIGNTQELEEILLKIQNLIQLENEKLKAEKIRQEAENFELAIKVKQLTEQLDELKNGTLLQRMFGK